MINSVSFAGNQAGAYQATAPKKTSNAKKGAMIGAGLGLANSAFSLYRSRAMLKEGINAGIQLGFGKNRTIVSIATGLAFGLAVSVGIGSLLGAGIGKIVDHFKKPKADVLDTKLAQDAKVDTEA